MTINWYQSSTEEILSELSTSPKGLTQEKANQLLKENGPNILTEKKKRTHIMMFLDQFRDFMIIVLIIAALISGFIGEFSDTIAILVIVILNAVIGFVQEYRAEKAMAALKSMAAPRAIVIRNGKIADIPASDLVLGDIVLVEAGQIIPADIRLIETAQLKIEEAALTGEAVPVEKHSETIKEQVLPLGDRKNLAFKGTIASCGRGKGVVVATGMQTELGKIATMLQEEEEVKTPLQKRLATFGRRLAIGVLVICAIIFIIGILRGEEPMLMLLTAISLAVAAIPEALPAVVTISLAIGAKKMVKQNALIRKLPAVETLGSVTYICSDKTGTLTLNKMTAEEIFVYNKVMHTSNVENGKQKSVESRINQLFLSPLENLLLGLSLNNDARFDKEGKVIGDPTEVALYIVSERAGYKKDELSKLLPRISEIPFDSERKCMTTIHAIANSKEMRTDKDIQFVSFTKGAIEVLLEKSSNILTPDGLKSIDKEEIQAVNDRMAADGLRVLGIAMKEWDSIPKDISADNIEKDLTLLGLIGMLDPPREEAKEAVTFCKTAGIRPVMITGDHPITAKVIANRLGILEDDSESIITGTKLDELTLDEFEERVQKIQVYARVAPEQKLKIIKALQDKDQFVAMTGDGVNDAPALKRADIGVSMGITGTDVAKEASHMILLDDNFATIVRAVKEGRRIFDNIRKFIRYTMTSNSGEIWTIFLAPFFGLPVPLLPIHILWINLVTDGLPGLALAAEPAEKDIMKRPPRDPQENIFTGMFTQIIWVGLLMGAVSLFTQAWGIQSGNPKWQTMVFTVLCLSQMGNVLAIRSEKDSLFKIGLFSNMPLIGAFVLTIILQMATIYVPFLNPIFKTSPLNFYELSITLSLSTIVFFAVEIDKWLRRAKT